MEKIFIDASFFIALLKKDDLNHTKAVKKLESLENLKIDFFINFLVVAEVATVVGQRVSKSQANEFLETYKKGIFTEIEIDNDIKSKAIEIYLEKRSKNFPFFDAIHVAFIQNKGINKILTFDRHFKSLGLKVI